MISFTVPLSDDIAVRYFDGAIPDWSTALSSSIPCRRIVDEVVTSFSQIHDDNTSLVALILGSGCEGKTTSLLQAAYKIIEEKKDWRIIRRTVETQPLIPKEIVSLLNIDYNWLIVIDEADNAASSIVELVNKLPIENRGKVHFLLAARDSDWFSSNSIPQSWPSCTFKELRVRGLDLNDATSIIECWRNYGARGLGNLYSVPVDKQSSQLLEASKRNKTEEGSAFFGALLAVRYGQNLGIHAKQMLDRLSKREIPSGGTLLDAIAYISAMDAIGMDFLSRSVLAEALGCPENNLRRTVLSPLGEEAAATTTSDFIFTRHPLIAKVIFNIIVYDFGIDEDDLYKNLIESAIRLRIIKKENVLELAGWRYKIVDYFFNNGKQSLAIYSAKLIRSYEPHNGGLLTKLAAMYRTMRQPEEACSLFRDNILNMKVFNDRPVAADWATCERESGNYLNSAVIAAYSLSDQFSLSQIQLSYLITYLHGLSYCFKQYYFEHLDNYAKIVSIAASYISLKLDNEYDRKEEILKNIEEIRQVSSVKEYGVSELYEALTNIMNDAKLHIENESIKEYVFSSGHLSFNSLKDILAKVTENNIKMPKTVRYSK